MSDDLVDTEEDEGLRKIVKEVERNEDEEDEDTDSGDKGDNEDDELDMTMEDLVGQKYAAKDPHEPILTPISPERQQPTTTQQPENSPSPIHIDKTPPSSPTKSPTQVTQTKPQPQNQQEKYPTPPNESNLEATNNVSEKITMQVIEENPLEEAAKAMLQKAQGEGLAKEGPATTDALAPGASASQETPTVVLTCIPKKKEDNAKFVLEKLSAKRREELGNTQKFFKNVAEIFQLQKVLQREQKMKWKNNKLVVKKEEMKKETPRRTNQQKRRQKPNQKLRWRQTKNNLLQQQKLCKLMLLHLVQLH